MMINYEKPTMKFINLRNREHVATNCWHLESNNSVDLWYYNYPGAGYVSFKVGGNCDSAGAYIVENFGVPEDKLGDVIVLLNSSQSKMGYEGDDISPDAPNPGEWS